MKLAEVLKNAIDSRRWPLRPQSLNIEVTSICDSKCIHCPRTDMKRLMKPMPLDLFKRIIDQASELKIPEVCPNGFGEIMTLRNIDEYLEYMNSRPHKFSITINTNGYRMTEDKIESLIRNQVSLLNICIDGATAEVAEKVRVGLKLDQIESNIHRLMEIRKERGISLPKIRVGFVQIPQNHHQVSQFVEKWQGKVDFVGVDGYSNRVGGLDESFARPEIQGRAGSCVLPFREMDVWSDGKVVICCNDWDEEHVVGDLNLQSIEEVWNGPALTNIRDLHRKKMGDQIEVCRKCNYWKAPTLGMRL